MKKQLKLFVWENVMTDWTPGIAFAMAYDVEEAREKIKESFNTDVNLGKVMSKDVEAESSDRLERLRKQLKDAAERDRKVLLQIEREAKIREASPHKTFEDELMCEPKVYDKPRGQVIHGGG